MSATLKGFAPGGGSSEPWPIASCPCSMRYTLHRIPWIQGSRMGLEGDRQAHDRGRLAGRYGALSPV
jgi:hypothetical protein